MPEETPQSTQVCGWEAEDRGEPTNREVQVAGPEVTMELGLVTRELVVEAYWSVTSPE